MTTAKIFTVLCVMTIIFYVIIALSFIRQASKHKSESEILILTRYIRRNQHKLSKKLSLVQSDRVRNVESYAGYLRVNKIYNSNMFFWYFPARNNSGRAPIVLWLGRLGISSLYSIFTETGPFSLNLNLTFELNEYSWNVNYNMLYVDSPIGVGFSFTDEEDGYSTRSIDIGMNLLNVIVQFLQLFPELRMNALFINVETNDGSLVAALTYAISQHNRVDKNEINFQGFVRNSQHDSNSQSNYFDSGFFNQDKQHTGWTGYNFIYNVFEVLPKNIAVDYLLTYTDFKKSIHVGNVEFNKNTKMVQMKLANEMLSD